MSSPSGHLPPMGWYPDPAGSGEERYWDGSAWTANLRASQPLLPPPGAPDAARPVSPVVPSGPAGPTGGTRFAPESSAGWYQTGLAGVEAPRGIVVAGWWMRALGYAIDSMALYLLDRLLLAPVWNRVSDVANSVASRVTADPQMGPTQLLQLLTDSGLVRWSFIVTGAETVIAAIYFAVLYRFLHASLGQRALNLRVVPAGRADQPLTWSMCLIRGVAKAVLFALPVVSLVAILWPAFSSTRQGLHDLAARTQVIRR